MILEILQRTMFTRPFVRARLTRVIGLALVASLVWHEDGRSMFKLCFLLLASFPDVFASFSDLLSSFPDLSCRISTPSSGNQTTEGIRVTVTKYCDPRPHAHSRCQHTPSLIRQHGLKTEFDARLFRASRNQKPMPVPSSLSAGPTRHRYSTALRPST